MKIKSFQIENFRNIRLAECSSLPDFVVICGSNGCGKSAILEAIMTAKERTSEYGGFIFDPNIVSADASSTKINMKLEFSDMDLKFAERLRIELSDVVEINIEIEKESRRVSKSINPSVKIGKLLSYYSSKDDSPGFFDYIEAHRPIQKSRLASWTPDSITDEITKETFTSGGRKFRLTKNYLANLKMRDLQDLQRTGKSIDSLREIKEFFDEFFSPKKFKDVLMYDTPFKFIISTPIGDIDIDDLSSGEKEILNIFIRFHQLNPKGSIILFDEADAHLHPELARRYLEVLKRQGQNNQILLTTHSPEMMIAAGTDSLYTILKEPSENLENQFVRVTQNEDLHRVLSEIMGSKGFVSFNRRIIFIEGEDSSADKEIYEAAYPPSKHNVTFVPAGNSATVRSIAERINALLTAPMIYQEYYCIVDRDIDRFEPDPTEGKRLFKLPVYHIENLLVNEEEIFKVTHIMLAKNCPYSSVKEVTHVLKELVFSDNHFKPCERALFDAKTAKIAKDASRAIWKNQRDFQPDKIVYSEIKKEARNKLQNAIDKDTWRAECKGRDLLKAYCGKHSLKYEIFRNIMISRISKDSPPPILADIMKNILNKQ